MVRRILILGGTGEATALAQRIAQIPALEVITSLAGRTSHPAFPSKQTRVGGFGGVAGLVEYLQTHCIDGLIDATHPFAQQISFHAATAASQCGIPRLMLVRPAWQPIAGDRWLTVGSNQQAAEILPTVAHRIFLTIGRQEISTFAPLRSLWFLMRMIDPPHPNIEIPPGKILLERGPFSLEAEITLLQDFHIEAIVSKNSGGDATYAKIAAARQLGIPVIMVQRPPIPDGECVSDIEQVLKWLTAFFSP